MTFPTGSIWRWIVAGNLPRAKTCILLVFHYFIEISVEIDRTCSGSVLNLFFWRESMVWDKTKEILQGELSDNVFNLWIEPLACVQVQEDRIRLACPDRFFSAYIAQNYLGIIQEKLNEADPLQRKVILCEGKNQPIPTLIKGEQLRLPTLPAGGSCLRSLHPRYTFEEFMVGESNILAQSACRSKQA